jgi:CHAT domain-containing protein
MVFFGTHGLNRPDRPLETKLVVHGGQRDDSLTAREIFASRVRSDLIVMSACETGLADRSPLPGDDLFGIQRAFLQSGARTVLSGLWNVPEVSGPDLMEVFFRNLAKGESASAALADSQRAFLKKRRGAKDLELLLQILPMYWAVYTIAGDQRTGFAR